MKTLNLSFKGSLGKGHTLKLNYASDNLDEKVIREAMNQIVSSQLIQKDDDNLYARVSGAKYVTTTDQVIFAEASASNK